MRGYHEVDMESYSKCERGFHADNWSDAFEMDCVDKYISINISRVQRGKFIQPAMVLYDAVYQSKIGLGADRLLCG